MGGRMSARRRLGPLAVLALAVLAPAGCGYFNALYNAERRFAEAERLATEGRSAQARAAYEESLLKASSSYRAHPEGRWSDDALLLIGRAHFALGRNAEASAALDAAVRHTDNARMRATAEAYLGATAVRAERPAAALPHLDRALAELAAGSPEAAFAHLWRARARFATGDAAAAWAELDAAAIRSDPLAHKALLEGATRALALGDSARLRAAVARLLGDAGARATLDSLRTLAAVEARAHGPAAAALLLAPVAAGAWPAAARDSLRLVRAAHLAAGGDTAAALDELGALADGAAPGTAQAARHTWSRLRLRGASGLDELGEVRAILLPAVGHPPAARLVDHMRTLEELVERAGQGRPLALFVAAEMARDSLAAPQLAVRLFTAYAELAPAGVWAPKALLAGALLAPPEEAAALRARAVAVAGNPYVTPGDAAGFEDAERRLDGQLAGLLEEARSTARGRDAAVSQHVAALDSLRVVARTDSLRMACGAQLEEAAVLGIRADSARAACVRGDSARVRFVLALQDTAALCDTTCAADDRVRRPGNDTFPPLPDAR